MPPGGGVHPIGLDPAIHGGAPNLARRDEMPGSPPDFDPGAGHDEKNWGVGETARPTQYHANFRNRTLAGGSREAGGPQEEKRHSRGYRGISSRRRPAPIAAAATERTVVVGRRNPNFTPPSAVVSSLSRLVARCWRRRRALCTAPWSGAASRQQTKSLPLMRTVPQARTARLRVARPRARSARSSGASARRLREVKSREPQPTEVGARRESLRVSAVITSTTAGWPSFVARIARSSAGLSAAGSVTVSAWQPRLAAMVA